jgi:hypothetical protein
MFSNTVGQFINRRLVEVATWLEWVAIDEFK